MEPAWGCRNELFNAKVLWLADKADWKTAGLTYARLAFLRETPADCARVFRAYRTGAGRPQRGSPGAVLPGGGVKPPSDGAVGDRVPFGWAAPKHLWGAAPRGPACPAGVPISPENGKKGRGYAPGPRVHGPLTLVRSFWGSLALVR